MTLPAEAATLLLLGALTTPVLPPEPVKETPLGVEVNPDAAEADAEIPVLPPEPVNETPLGTED